MIEILPIQRRALDCLLHESRVVRVSPLENPFHGRCRRALELEDSKSFF
jgi:hypothetical protein